MCTSTRGDTTPFTNATFVVSAGARALLEPGYPADPKSLYASDLLPPERTTSTYLDPASWAPLGPFPRAHDFFGDGSLYLVDAEGHCPGHVNVLARTSVDGGWVYLAGDSAHDWRLIKGLSGIADGDLDCARNDNAAAARTIERIRAVSEFPRTNKDGAAFWQGKIESP